MKVVVCDVCRTDGERAGGLFNLVGDGIEVDICGGCAVNVLASLIETSRDSVTTALEMAKPRPRQQPQQQRQQQGIPQTTMDGQDFEALEQFIREASRPIVDSVDAIRKRIDVLTADVGEPVFVQELGGNPKIGSRVGIGMPGRKIGRRVEVVEAVPGQPGNYFVFQVKE